MTKQIVYAGKVSYRLWFAHLFLYSAILSRLGNLPMASKASEYLLQRMSRDLPLVLLALLNGFPPPDTTFMESVGLAPSSVADLLQSVSEPIVKYELARYTTDVIHQ